MTNNYKKITKSIIIPSEFMKNNKKCIINIIFKYNTKKVYYDVDKSIIDNNINTIMKFLYAHITLLEPYIDINRKVISDEIQRMTYECQFMFNKIVREYELKIDKWWFGRLEKGLDIVI